MKLKRVGKEPRQARRKKNLIIPTLLLPLPWYSALPDFCFLCSSTSSSQINPYTLLSIRQSESLPGIASCYPSCRHPHRHSSLPPPLPLHTHLHHHLIRLAFTGCRYKRHSCALSLYNRLINLSRATPSIGWTERIYLHGTRNKQSTERAMCID